MYCTKCGKKADPGDKFCAQCGNKLGSAVQEEKPKGSGLGKMVALIVAILVLSAFFLGREDTKQKEEKEAARWETLPETTETAQSTTEAQPQQELVYYSDGSIYKIIDYYPNGVCKQILQNNAEGQLSRSETYREDGTLRQITDYEYDSSGKHTYTTAMEFDDHENILSCVESYPGGAVSNSYFYSYAYDDQGRMVEMINYNKNSVLMQEEYRTYHADGGYTRDYTEYRGANTYDWEFDSDDPDVANKWYHAIVECDAEGHELSVICDFADGHPQEG